MITPGLRRRDRRRAQHERRWRRAAIPLRRGCRPFRPTRQVVGGEGGAPAATGPWLALAVACARRTRPRGIFPPHELRTRQRPLPATPRRPRCCRRARCRWTPAPRRPAARAIPAAPSCVSNTVSTLRSHSAGSRRSQRELELPQPGADHVRAVQRCGARQQTHHARQQQQNRPAPIAILRAAISSRAAAAA